MNLFRKTQNKKTTIAMIPAIGCRSMKSGSADRTITIGAIKKQEDKVILPDEFIVIKPHIIKFDCKKIILQLSEALSKTMRLNPLEFLKVTHLFNKSPD
ncbi:MAG: hypothetical protein PQJ46_01715 [Spirochaetales bacterium]|nr:hypothetical protein [Spirochaetales bacterium]